MLKIENNLCILQKNNSNNFNSIFFISYYIKLKAIIKREKKLEY